jgi:hypothetical protein
MVSRLPSEVFNTDINMCSVVTLVGKGNQQYNIQQNMSIILTL